MGCYLFPFWKILISIASNPLFWKSLFKFYPLQIYSRSGRLRPKNTTKQVNFEAFNNVIYLKKKR